MIAVTVGLDNIDRCVHPNAYVIIIIILLTMYDSDNVLISGIALRYRASQNLFNSNIQPITALQRAIFSLALLAVLPSGGTHGALQNADEAISRTAHVTASYSESSLSTRNACLTDERAALSLRPSCKSSPRPTHTHTHTPTPVPLVDPPPSLFCSVPAVGAGCVRQEEVLMTP